MNLRTRVVLRGGAGSARLRRRGGGVRQQRQVYDKLLRQGLSVLA